MLQGEKSQELPQKFSEKHMAHLSDSAILSTNCNLYWVVDFKITESRKVFMCGPGFRDFMNHYKLSKCDLLVFTYDGESRFHVNIFRPDACEIEYPFRIPDNANEEAHPSGGQSSNGCTKQKEKMSCREIRRNKRRNIGIVIEDRSNSELGSRQSPIIIPDAIKRSEKRKGMVTDQNMSFNMSSRNSIYINDNCFDKIIKSSSPIGKQKMALPAFFVRCHPELYEKYTDCIITASDGTEQICGLAIYFRNKLPEIYIRGGWQFFSLKVSVKCSDRVRFSYRIDIKKGLPVFNLKLVHTTDFGFDGTTLEMGCTSDI